MPVEFIGMIATQTPPRPARRRARVIDPTTRARFARAHEDAGFDRVLIGYGSAAPDGCQVAALRRRAHRAARPACRPPPRLRRPDRSPPRTSPRSTSSPAAGVAVHIITGGNDAEQRRDGDYLAKDERYARTDEYLRDPRGPGPPTEPFDHEGRYYRFEDSVADVRPRQQPRIPLYFGGSSEAAYRVGGEARRHLRAVGRAAGRDRRADRAVRAAAAAAGRDRRRASASRSARSSAPPRSWRGSARTASSTRIKASGSADVAAPASATDGHRRRTPARSGCWPPPRAASSTTAPVDADRRGDRRARQLHRAGRHARDGRRGAARLRRPRRHHAADPRLRPARRRHRLRPRPDPAGPRRSSPAATARPPPSPFPPDPWSSS